MYKEVHKVEDFKRILLKLSGEALAGSRGFGFDEATCLDVADQVKQLTDSGKQVAIVIGGGVSKAGQPLIDCIQKYYRQYAFSLCKDTPMVIASLGNDAGIYGAAKMVL